MAIATGLKIAGSLAVTIFASYGVFRIYSHSEAMQLARQYGHVRAKAINAPEIRIDSLKGGADKLVPKLKHLPELRILGIHGVDLPAKLVDSIGDLDQVEVLKLGGCGLDDEDLVSLSRLPDVRRLGLSGNDITDRAFDSIAKMESVTHLDISRTAIEGHLLSKLSTLPNLYEIDLSGTKMNDETMQQLVEIRTLRRISLNNTSVTRTGIMQLAELPWLEYLAMPSEAYEVPDNASPQQESDALWQLHSQFNDLKREKIREAATRGEAVPAQFVSPFPERRLE